MKFNSQSVLMKRGVNHRVPVNLPNQLEQYEIAEDVWGEAIQEFNKKLDRRPHVTMKFFLQKDIKVDVLRIHRTSASTTLWLMVKGDEIDIVDKVPFTLKGEVVFAENSDTKVDKMVIEDVLYDANCGIFTKELTS